MIKSVIDKLRGLIRLQQSEDKVYVKLKDGKILIVCHEYNPLDLNITPQLAPHIRAIEIHGNPRGNLEGGKLVFSCVKL